MLFELFADVSFGILEGDRRRRTRSAVLTLLMTPLTACGHGMVRTTTNAENMKILQRR